ncbi:MAG: NfeD family protein [Clostridia bacterium]|nr:NfeD family protein [Clostridia bacterium]
MDTVEIVWAALIVIFLIIEGATAGLSSIWFALGAVAGLILSLLNVGLVWQIVAFIVVSIATLLLTRPLAMKYVSTKVQATNADRVIGQTGIVLEEINNISGTGAVKIGGKIWTARSANGSVIAKDVLVTGIKINGATLMVSISEADENSSAQTGAANVSEK